MQPVAVLRAVRSMNPINQLSEKISARWREPFLLVGVLLTLVWICLLVWFPLRLLNLV
jgi:hypothetical protein